MIGKIDSVAAILPHANGVWMPGRFAVSQNIVDFVCTGVGVLPAQALSEIMKCNTDFFRSICQRQLCVGLARANHIAVRAGIEIAQNKYRQLPLLLTLRYIFQQHANALHPRIFAGVIQMGIMHTEKLSRSQIPQNHILNDSGKAALFFKTGPRN